MTNEQKLREALQDLEREISSRFGANEDMSPELRKVILSAREALSQPTSDEGTPTVVWAGKEPTVEQLKELVERQERTLHAKERELADLQEQAEQDTEIHRRAIIQLRALYGQQPTTWRCGWNEASNRCLRFDCKRSGPCSGFATPTPSDTKPGDEDAG